MLQSWETFFSPTGGYMDNKLETGYTGLAVDFGSSLVNKYIYSPLEKHDIKLLGDRRAAFRTKIDNRSSPINTILGGKEVNVSNWSNQHSRGKEYRSRMSRYDRKLTSVLSGTRSKYRSMRATAKMVGWGYLGLAAAAGVQAALAPGVSRATIESNNNLVAPTLDTNIAYTQRQRALMAIHDSQLGIRNVISQEATSFHK